MKTALLFCLALSLAATPARGAATRKIVIANEALVEGGKYLPANVEAFVRRLQKLGGWPGLLKGKALGTG